MEWTLVDDIVSKLYSYHVVLPEMYENLNSLDEDLNYPLLVCSNCENLMI